MEEQSMSKYQRKQLAKARGTWNQPEAQVALSIIANFERRDAEKRDSHVYALTVERVGADWFAVAQNDGHEVYRLSCGSKFLAARCGLAAMRAYIIRGHRRTWRTARKAAKMKEEVQA